MSATAQLLTAASATGDAVLIRALGSCTLGVCPPLKAFLAPLKSPETKQCYIDLSQTEYIDSSFTGLLLSLARRSGQSDSPAFKIVAPSSKVLDVIRSMHLQPFFAVERALPAERGEWSEIPMAEAGAAPLGETVVECHQAIIDADERNRAEFGRVVEVFESELKRSAPDDQAR